MTSILSPRNNIFFFLAVNVRNFLSNKQEMRVLKFGGTSLKHGWNEILALLDTVDGPAIVVVSALAGVTKRLRNNQSVLQLHRQFLTTYDIDFRKPVDDIWQHVDSHIHDDIMRISYGEKCMAMLMGHALGVPHVITDRVISTDGPLMSARVVDIDKKCMDTLLANNNSKIVVTGFIARDKQTGQTSLLGASGSDVTATALAKAYGVTAEIYTDVDGILTADPHIVPHAMSVSHMSKVEAKELGFSGASVIHPLAIDAAGEYPIQIINTFTRKKTIIGNTSSNTYFVSFLPCETLISITDASMLNGIGRLAKLCTLVTKSGTNIRMLSQSCSEQNISCVVPSLSQSYCTVLNDTYDEVQFTPVSIITVTGKNLKGEIGIASHIFAAVASVGINVLCIAQGASEYSISFAVHVTHGSTAAKVVHQWLVEGMVY
jgi:bifunctional aspartokinase / homoserine dehydrogenase 1